MLQIIRAIYVGASGEIQGRREWALDFSQLILICSFSTVTVVKQVMSPPCTWNPTAILISAWQPSFKIIVPPPNSNSPPQGCNSPTSSAARKETYCNSHLSGLLHLACSNWTASRSHTLLPSFLNKLLLSLQQICLLPTLPPYLPLPNMLPYLLSRWRWMEKRNVAESWQQAVRKAWEVAAATAAASASASAMISVSPQRAHASTWATVPMMNSCVSAVHLHLRWATSSAQQTVQKIK